MKVLTVAKNRFFNGWYKTNEYRAQIVDSLKQNNAEKEKSDRILETYDWIESNSKNYFVRYTDNGRKLSIIINNKFPNKNKPGGSAIVMIKGKKPYDFISRLDSFLDYTKKKLEIMNRDNF